MEVQTSAPAASAADDPWSKLPGDILGEVYGRTASPVHRVRFAAVCRWWRAFASSQPRQPAIPWLVLSAERLFCPVDGAILRAPFPSDMIGKSLVGFHDGGWIAATSGVGAGVSLVIVNLLSGAEVPLSAKQRTPRRTIRKVAFSEAPTSKHCILAATTPGLALCRVGSPNHSMHSWWKSEYCKHYEDIVFCRGKLYGLQGGTLFMHDIRMTKAGSTVVSTTREVRTDQRPRGPVPFSMSYIVEYKDTLLLVTRALGASSREYIFKVFELVSTENACCCHDHMWAEVTTLDDHALFLSTKCSKAVPVPPSGRSGVERNHIYYDYVGNLPREHVSILDNLHCMKNREGNGADRIMSRGYFLTSRREDLTWLLPPDF